MFPTPSEWIDYPFDVRLSQTGLFVQSPSPAFLWFADFNINLSCKWM